MPLLRELHGVAEEVERDLPEALRVEHQQGHPPGPEAQFEPGLAVGAAERPENFVQEPGAIDRPGVDRHAPGFEPGQIEHVVDEREEGSAAREDGVDGLRAFLLRAEPRLEHLGKAGDRIEGRADVVAHGGEEVAAGPGLFALRVPLPLPEDGVEVEEDDEGDEHQHRLDEASSREGGAQFASLLLKGDVPARVGVVRDVGERRVVDALDVGDRPARGVARHLPHPQQRHEGDEDEQREPNDRRLAKAAPLVVAEHVSKAGEPQNAPQHEQQVRLRGHHRARGVVGHDEKHQDDGGEDDPADPGKTLEKAAPGEAPRRRGGVGVREGGADGGDVDDKADRGASQKRHERRDGGDGEDRALRGAVGGPAREAGVQDSVVGHRGEEPARREEVSDEPGENGPEHRDADKRHARAPERAAHGGERREGQRAGLLAEPPDVVGPARA